MQRMRKLAALPLAVAAAALALTACAPAGGSGQTAGETDTLTLGMTADVPGLSPFIQPSYQGWFADAAWDTLLICDEFGKPSAAAGHGVGVQRGPEPPRPSRFARESSSPTAPTSTPKTSRPTLTAVGEVERPFRGPRPSTSPTRRTITITFPQPIPTLDLIMCEAQITSSEAIEADKLDSEVVGSGPYIYDAAASTQGSSYTLTKNPDYWDSDTYPYEKLVLKVFTDGTAGLNALKTGQIDGILGDASTVEEAKNSGMEAVTLRGVTTRLLITDHNGEKIPALGRCPGAPGDEHGLRPRRDRGGPVPRIRRPGVPDLPRRQRCLSRGPHRGPVPL